MTIDFSTFEEMEFPEHRNFVYVLYVREEGTELLPFYVGESSRHVYGRIGDYISGQFTAPADFKVGEAVKYLRKKGLRVAIKFRKSDNRKDEEKRILQDLRGTCQLLNDLKGYNYVDKTSSENDKRQKIQQFIDKILANRR